jgi:hypothetical protein
MDWKQLIREFTGMDPDKEGTTEATCPEGHTWWQPTGLQYKYCLECGKSARTIKAIDSDNKKSEPPSV